MTNVANPSPRAAASSLAVRMRSQGLRLSASHGGDPQRKVGLSRGAGRLAGRADLVEQRLGGSQLSGGGVDVAEHAEGERDGRQCSHFPSTLDSSRREPPPGVVVPEVRCGPQREREPTALLRWQNRFTLERAQGSFEQWSASRVSPDDLDRQRLEKEIRRSWCRWQRRGPRARPRSPSRGPRRRRADPRTALRSMRRGRWRARASGQIVRVRRRP